MAALESQIVEGREFTAVHDYRFSGDTVTINNKRRFVESYRETGTVLHAARAAGIARWTAYRYMEDDPEFAGAVGDSKEDCVDTLEASVYQRAFKSDLLAMFVMKAHRPMYRDKIMIDINAVRDEIQQRIGNTQLALPPTNSDNEQS